MEQRPLRLGDIVDDYCTRERRVTNHAVVAIVEDAIRQTRCTTCDTEHPYKGGKEPRLRKKPAGSELYDQVLAGANGSRPTEASSSTEGESQTVVASPGREPDSAEVEESDEARPAEEQAHDAWPAHRRLIRATLPRSDNEPPPPRPIPEFTMHQRPQPRSAHGFRFRGPQNGHANGNVAGGFGQGRPSRPGRHRNKKRPR